MATAIEAVHESTYAGPTSVASPHPVVFFLADEPDIHAIGTLDPDRDLRHFRHGERSWVAQTFLRLRAAGFPVILTDIPPERGMVVFHAKHKHELARAAVGRPELVFVAIRADNSSALLADFEVLQNGRFEDGRRRFTIPFWPQPGLISRDPGRGSRIETVGYIGLEENLHPDFRTDSWPRQLAALGIEWVCRRTRFRAMGDPALIDWEDYSRIDVVLTVRPTCRELEFAKPASKLVNAWRAGAPALVGAEYACREIRLSDDDYIEVRCQTDAIVALSRLKRDPGLYSRMVINGRRRAAEFTHEALVDRWAQLLFDTIPRRIADGELSWTRRLPIPLRVHARRLRRLLMGERAR